MICLLLHGENSPCIVVYIITSKFVYLLHYSMVQRHFREANSFATSQEIPRISRNPNVHHRTKKRPPNLSILCQPNPVHIPTFQLLEIRYNNIHPSTPGYPQWSLSSGFFTKTLYPPLLTHKGYMPSPTHFYRFYFRALLG